MSQDRLGHHREWPASHRQVVARGLPGACRRGGGRVMLIPARCKHDPADLAPFTDRRDCLSVQCQRDTAGIADDQRNRLVGGDQLLLAGAQRILPGKSAVPSWLEPRPYQLPCSPTCSPTACLAEETEGFAGRAPRFLPEEQERTLGYSNSTWRAPSYEESASACWSDATGE